MKRQDYYFDLPEELIAQTPLKNRDHSKLMVVDKETGEVEEKIFKDIIEYLDSGDTLILNDTRVMPARIFGIKDTGAKVEFLLLKRVEDNKWQTLVKPGRRAKIGSKFSFGDGLMTGEIVDTAEEGSRIIEFSYDGIFENILDQLGEMPLPPYITESLSDKERYQTVYSKEVGSAAAPTAGLHFTEDLLEILKSKGINIGFITLHVGLGTFRPVKADNILDHKMHSEFYILSEETAKLINDTKESGKKVISVGTTSTRTLESVGTKGEKIEACSGWTDIFIYPGYEFKVIDGMITNFHLPESTLIMLVSALSDRESILKAYETAVENKYRFFSFGDAMFIK